MQAIACMGLAAAPLGHLKAAAVAAPTANLTAVAEPSKTNATAVAEPATTNATEVAAAQQQVLAAVHKLARELRKSKAWIGYVAFIGFALCKECQPHAWEGGLKFNRLETPRTLGNGALLQSLFMRSNPLQLRCKTKRYS